MRRLLLRIIAIAIITLTFSAEMKAQFVNQVGVRSDYVDKGKIYIGGAPLAREDAVKVLGEDLGQQYKKELNRKGASKALLIVGGTAVGMGALWAASYQMVYSNIDDENADTTWDRFGSRRKLKGSTLAAVLSGGACMIAGAVISQSATKNINMIRNTYNKGLSENEMSYSVGFTGNGVAFALNF